MSYTDKKELVKLVSYMSTFDGGLYLPSTKKKDSKQNACFVINMRSENKDYLDWVKEVMGSITGIREYDRKDYNTDGYNRQPQTRLESNRHPFFTKIRDRIYIDNHKVIDPHMLKLMDAEALAIIFMADGSSKLETRFKNPSADFSINTKGFSYNDNMALSKTIYEKFGIRSTINRHNKYFYIRIKTADVLLFAETIISYVKPSFMYKIQRIAPYIKYKGGDMICSVLKDIENGRNDHSRNNNCE